MSYYNKEPPTCKYCSTPNHKTLIKFKKKPDGGWLVLNPNDTAHDRPYCDTKKQENQKLESQKTSYQPNHQARISTASPAPSSTFSRDEEPKAQGVTIFSLHVTISELRKEVKELRKQIETLASIADSTAQKTELLINKVGYPAPEVISDIEKIPVRVEKPWKKVYTPEEAKNCNNWYCRRGGYYGVENTETKQHLCEPCYTIFVNKDKHFEFEKSPERQKAYEENSKKFDETMKEIEGPVQRHPTQEELANSFKVPTSTEVINPMRVAKEEVPKSEMLTGSDIMEWQNISEAFVCHNCEAKTHNGYMKLGTKLCPNCKDSVESNEIEDDRSDVNNYKPRSIEDINDDL